MTLEIKENGRLFRFPTEKLNSNDTIYLEIKLKEPEECANVSVHLLGSDKRLIWQLALEFNNDRIVQCYLSSNGEYDTVEDGKSLRDYNITEIYNLTLDIRDRIVETRVQEVNSNSTTDLTDHFDDINYLYINGDVEKVTKLSFQYI